MAKPHRHQQKSGRTNLASCIVATIFLLFIVIVILIVFFTVFKPQDPKISVNAIQLPSFSISNNTVNFTFSQYCSVKNPNKAVFTHFDSSLQLLYAGNQVGFMFIPAGKIAAGRTQYMAATFAVQSFPLTATPATATAKAMAPGEVAGMGTGMGVGPDPTVTDGFGYGGIEQGAGRVGPSLEIESRLEMAGRVRVLGVFTHHVRARADCRVIVSVNDGSVLGFHC